MTHLYSSAGSNDDGASDAGPGPASTPGASLTRPRSSSADTDADTWLLCAAHFGTCVSWFLAPLVVWLWARASAPHVAARALAVLLWSALGTACAVATCGLAIPVFLVVVGTCARVQVGHGTALLACVCVCVCVCACARLSVLRRALLIRRRTPGRNFARSSRRGRFLEVELGGGAPW